MTTLNKLACALCLVVATASADAQTPIYSYTVPAGGYAPNGNLTAYTDSVTGTWTMQYDPLNRLQNATASAGAYQGINLQWQYDSFGNRLSQTPSGASNALVPVPWQARYNANNQMTSTLAAAPTYDAAGNVTFDGQATSVAYDAENRVCATTNTNMGGGITQYIYNAEGQRVAKGHPRNPPAGLGCADPNNFVVTATYVLGHSGEQMTEFDSAGAWQHTNVFNGGQLLATYDTRGLHFPQTDPLGTVRVQVSGTGAPEESCASLPFGDGLTCTGITDPTEHHFTGKERDVESGGTNGLDYFGARYYSSLMGRFSSPDPSGLYFADPTNPQSFNLYSYVQNNPLIFVDPDGLACIYINPDTNVFQGATIGDCDNSTTASANAGNYVDGNISNLTLRTTTGDLSGQVTGWTGTGTDDSGNFASFTGVSASGGGDMFSMSQDDRILALAEGVTADSQHSFGCIAQAYPGGSLAAGTGKAGSNLFNASQNLVTKPRFGGALGGSTDVTSEAAMAARASSWGSVPLRVPTPVGTPFTGSFAMRSSSTLGGAAGRYAPYAGAAGKALGVAGTAYSSYQLWNCLGGG